MKKSLIVCIAVILIFLFFVTFSQSTQSIVVQNNNDIITDDNSNSLIKKISPLNFEVVEDLTLKLGDADKYLAEIYIPEEEPKPKPIPIPTPAQEMLPGTEENLPYSIIVDVSKQVVSIMTRDEDGYFNNVYKQFRCSSGLNSTPTILGEFKVKKKAPWLISYPSQTVTGEDYYVYARYRTTIYDDYHFHSILYEGYRDFNSLKPTSFRNIGKKSSHGCVRLLVRDAKWLYTHCAIGTPISVRQRGGPALDASKVTEIPLNQKLPRGVTYDPTDLTHVNEIRLNQ